MLYEVRDNLAGNLPGNQGSVKKTITKKQKKKEVLEHLGQGVNEFK